MKMNYLLGVLLLSLSIFSCKKTESVTFDIRFDADTLAIDTLELMISDVWVNYATAKDYSKWYKISEVNKQFNWHDFSCTSDSLFLKGTVLEDATVLNQIRFVVVPEQSRGIMFMDTINVSLMSTALGVQGIINKRLSEGGKYDLRLKWSLSGYEIGNLGLSINPTIEVVSFNKK